MTGTLRAAAALAAGLLLAPGVASAAPTAGTGGPLTDRTFEQFTDAQGITSRYHIFADGLDTTRDVGLLLWMDGSGGYGFDNPTSTYLIDSDGTAGMRQVARDHNLLLVTPEAPAPACNGYDNCWYNESSTPNATAKSDWLRGLVDHVYSQYNVQTDLVAIGGYSSGAQATTRWFLPRHGAAVQTDGLFVAVAYGGAPHVSAGTPNFPQSYKDKVHGYWNTGTSDTAYTSASYGAIGGYNWYTGDGFATSADWPAGVGHSRGGEFAGIMRAQIDKHLQPSAPAPAPAPWETSVSPTQTGGTFAVNVPAGYSGPVYVRLSSGNYLYNSFTGPTVAKLTFSKQQCGRTLDWTTEAPSGTARDSGTFTTLPC